jgi:hemerythrin
MSAPEKSAAMSPFEWRSELLLHVDQIDRQHQELLARARILNEALNAAEPQHEIEAKLLDLIGFTEMHFSSEEEAMRAHSYEGYTAHQAMHRELSDQMHVVRRGLLDGTVAPCQILSHFLEAWVNHHISGPDKQFATFLRSKSDA